MGRDEDPEFLVHSRRNSPAQRYFNSPRLQHEDYCKTILLAPVGPQQGRRLLCPFDLRFRYLFCAACPQVFHLPKHDVFHHNGSVLRHHDLACSNGQVSHLMSLLHPEHQVLSTQTVSATDTLAFLLTLALLHPVRHCLVSSIHLSRVRIASCKLQCQQQHLAALLLRRQQCEDHCFALGAFLTNDCYAISSKRGSDQVK